MHHLKYSAFDYLHLALLASCHATFSGESELGAKGVGSTLARG